MQAVFATPRFSSSAIASQQPNLTDVFSPRIRVSAFAFAYAYARFLGSARIRIFFSNKYFDNPYGTVPPVLASSSIGYCRCQTENVTCLILCDATPPNTATVRCLILVRVDRRIASDDPSETYYSSPTSCLPANKQSICVTSFIHTAQIKIDS